MPLTSLSAASFDVPLLGEKRPLDALLFPPTLFIFAPN